MHFCLRIHPKNRTQHYAILFSLHSTDRDRRHCCEPDDIHRDKLRRSPQIPQTGFEEGKTKFVVDRNVVERIARDADRYDILLIGATG